MTSSEVNESSHSNNKEDSETSRETPVPMIAPTSPNYPPYGIYIDPSQLAYEDFTYAYPISPQFSVQYYPDYTNGYQSYPGSPSLHPQSPPMNPTSPPFIPSYSPYITSPVLTGATSIPGSPPHHYLPGPYIIQDKRRTPRQDHNTTEEYHTHNVYVRGLPSSTTDDSFLEMCQVYGSVVSSKAIVDQKTGDCKGYGFAMFENEKDSEEAIEGLNKAGLQASFARVGQESFSSRLRHLQDETSTNIYISNLPLDITEQSLEELFQPYQIVSNRILRDPRSGLSRGVGFARMTDREAASAIIENFNGVTIDGCTAPLQVRFADSAAQKKLKNQTGRKRIIRPCDFQPVATFTMRPMMPITPETMLGIAPAVPHGYYQDPYLHQSPS